MGSIVPVILLLETSNQVSDGNTPITAGIVPDKRFSFKWIICKFFKSPNSAGREEVSLFENISRRFSETIPIKFEGMGPVKLLPYSSRFSSCCRFCMFSGIRPFSLHRLRTSCFRDFISLISDGMDPRKLFNDRFSVVKSDNCPNSLGNCPVKPELDKSSIFNDFRFPISVGIAPVKDEHLSSLRTFSFSNLPHSGGKVPFSLLAPLSPIICKLCNIPISEGNPLQSLDPAHSFALFGVIAITSPSPPQETPGRSQVFVLTFSQCFWNSVPHSLPPVKT
mmetsp:Transcript_4564/g.6925  ORF Transcript_4564/g.6925 Transcript_4564/m.6925 type:complete len:279 (-) Transcript_4564:346-1182(-)